MTAPFMTLAKTVALAEGISDVCFMSVPHPIGMLPHADIRKKAEDAFAEVLQLANGWQPSVGTGVKRAAYPAERFEFTGTEADVNRHFLAKEWSLGLPIIPPTSERVAEMLKGTHRRPGEVLGQVPPKMSPLTVELVAVHAVMAGGEPEYMPVLMAALEGFLEPKVNWRGSLATTGTTQFVVIVNGPIVKKLGIASGQGAAGKGHHPNAAIGYAINLIAYAVGGSKPPAIDRSTLASPADYVCWVFGENEEALPSGWEPLHVDRGFKWSDSTVTVLASYPPLENIDHWSVTAEDYVRWWRYTVSPMHNIGGPCYAAVMKQNPIVALGPEHAHLVAAEGWRKIDFCQAFWEQVRVPLSAWPPGCADRDKLQEDFDLVNEDTLIPVTLKAEQLLIVVAGGDGKHSHYFAPFLDSFTVSKLIGD
jgi:hypothetical protein